MKKNLDKNKITILSMTIILILIIIISINQEQKTFEDPTVQEIFDECSELEKEKKTICLDSFYNVLANINLDEKSCKKISNDIIKKECLDSTFLTKAITNRDPDICKDHSQPQKCQDSYYWQLAYEEKNLEYCENIKNEAKAISCHNTYYLEEAVRKGKCDLLKDYVKHECEETWVMQKVLDADDVNLCSELLDNAHEIEECEESYYEENIFIGEQGK